MSEMNSVEVLQKRIKELEDALEKIWYQGSPGVMRIAFDALGYHPQDKPRKEELKGSKVR